MTASKWRCLEHPLSQAQRRIYDSYAGAFKVIHQNIEEALIGAACHALVERLFAHRVLDNLRAAQGVIGLARCFGTQRLEAACQRALTFDDPTTAP